MTCKIFGTVLKSNLYKMKRDTLIIGVLIAAGLLYRIFLASLAVNDPRFDVATYESLAKDFLGGRLAIDCCAKNSGYSGFLALIYFFFGTGNHQAVQSVQIVLDLASGLLLYRVSRIYFSASSAVITFLIYMLNPLTSSYTGILLPEVVSIFFLSLLLFVISKQNNISSVTVWFFTGFLLGIMVFIRTQFFILAVLFAPVFTLFCVHKGKRLIFAVIVTVAFIIASSYSLAGNYLLYERITFIPPYGPGFMQMYEVFTRTGPYPEVPEEYSFDDPVRQSMLIDYFQAPLHEKSEITNLYTKKFQEKIRVDWLLFIKKYYYSMFWIWDKRHLYYYQDPFYAIDHFPIKIGNAVLLALALTGLVKFSVSKKFSALRNPLYVVSTVFLVGASVIYPLVSYESRHTITLYGLVFLWAGYGVVSWRTLVNFYFRRKKQYE